MKLATILTLSVLTISTAAFAEATATEPATRLGRAGTQRQRAAAAQMTPEQRLDARENNQQRRIAAGAAQHQLTADEIAKLKTLETNIQTMETNFKSDGTLSKEETKALRDSLNAASLQIWAERHDTEGNQKPAAVLGKNIFAQEQLTAKLESPDLTKAQAHEFLQDFRKLITLKHRLATETLPAEQRAKLQTEYTGLLNKYFVIKAPAPTASSTRNH
jgi:hypothetical protein